MKKLLTLIILSIAFTVSCHAQKDSLNKKVQDTVAVETTPLLSYNDINLLFEKVLLDMPLRYAGPIRDALITLLSQREVEYNAKKKLQKKQNK